MARSQKDWTQEENIMIIQSITESANDGGVMQDGILLASERLKRTEASIMRHVQNMIINELDLTVIEKLDENYIRSEQSGTAAHKLSGVSKEIISVIESVKVLEGKHRFHENLIVRLHRADDQVFSLKKKNKLLSTDLEKSLLENERLEGELKHIKENLKRVLGET